MERTYLKQYFTLDLQKFFYIAELVLSERCTIGFCCCQRKRRQIVKAFFFCRENGLLKETKSELEHAIAETERPLR